MGAHNPISDGIKDLICDIDDNSTEFESLAEADPLYPGKILYSMDTRIQRFLGQCKSYKDREDVNEKLVNFEDISENNLNQCFNVTLPIAFQLKTNKDDDSNKHLIVKSPDKK